MIKCEGCAFAQEFRVVRLSRCRLFDKNKLRKRTGLALLEHGFNTSFRVDTSDGRRFALRISVNSHFDPEVVDAFLEAEAEFIAIAERFAETSRLEACKP